MVYGWLRQEYLSVNIKKISNPIPLPPCRYYSRNGIGMYKHRPRQKHNVPLLLMMMCPRSTRRLGCDSSAWDACMGTCLFGALRFLTTTQSPTTGSLLFSSSSSDMHQLGLAESFEEGTNTQGRLFALAAVINYVIDLSNVFRKRTLAPIRKRSPQGYEKPLPTVRFSGGCVATPA